MVSKLMVCINNQLRKVHRCKILCCWFFI